VSTAHQHKTISLSSGIISFVGQVSEPVYNWDSSLAKFSSTPKKIKNKNKNKKTQKWDP
jgi:hypothetical protein